MVERIGQVVAEYEGRLRSTQWVPRCSYTRGMLRRDGAPNKKFLTYLFGDMELGIQFLKDVGLIRSKVQECCRAILIIFRLGRVRIFFLL